MDEVISEEGDLDELVPRIKDHEIPVVYDGGIDRPDRVPLSSEGE